MIGQTIGRYKVLEKIGSGGMGEVFKAEDTTLGRPVALKFLAPHLLNDGEAKTRFLREARAAAALEHPNICTVFEVAEENGKTFLSMSFLDGESLEDRIARGPLPLKDALDIGRQIADGLEAAHEKGIVHRDIKPANVMIDAKGRATILDFGLARLTEASKLTRQDQTVGTVAYMSPEQVQGQEVDRRTDIWALGCVLYEMVAGVRPFRGQYDQALAYEIVQQEPEPLTGVRAAVPIELEFIVGKCLAKETEDRYGSAEEVARDLRTLGDRVKVKSGRSRIMSAGGAVVGVPAGVATGRVADPAETPPPDAVIVQRSSQRALQSLAALLAIAFLLVLALHFGAADSEAPVRRFSFSHSGLLTGKISPDGRYVVFAAGADGEISLWLRALDSETPRRIPGTTGVSGTRRTPIPLAWSPDSRFVVFGTTNQLKRVAIAGGDPARLCDLPESGAYPFLGATWSPDGNRIIFSSGLSLWEVPALGGEPTRFLTAERGETYYGPEFLSAGSLAYVTGAASVARIEILDLATGERRDAGRGIAPTAAGDRYLLRTSPSGLTATPYSPGMFSPAGSEFPIDETGGWASVSRDGTLAYSDRLLTDRRQAGVRDRTGALLRTVGDSVAAPHSLSVSPDSRRIAASVDGDVLVYDLDRDIGTRMPSGAETAGRVAWTSNTDLSYTLSGDPSVNSRRLVTQPADGSTDPVTILEATPGFVSFDWSADGRYLVYAAAAATSGGEGGIWYRERRTDGSLADPVSYLVTPASENQGAISPDGRYLAYRSDESGRYEVYVRPFPRGPGKWQVSNDGGVQPVWSADGTELFYKSGTALMAVAVSAESSFTVGLPELLFESEDLQLTDGDSTPYSVFPDGRRIAVFAPYSEESGEAGQVRIHIVENWLEEFRDRE